MHLHFDPTDSLPCIILAQNHFALRYACGMWFDGIWRTKQGFLHCAFIVACNRYIVCTPSYDVVQDHTQNCQNFRVRDAFVPIWYLHPLTMYMQASCISSASQHAIAPRINTNLTLYLFLSATYLLALYMSSSSPSNQSAGNSSGSMLTPDGLIIPGRPPMGLKYMLQIHKPQVCHLYYCMHTLCRAV